MLVLLVGKSEKNLAYLEALVARCYVGSTVIKACSYIKALELIANTDKIDICFTEVLMGTGTGFQIAKEVRYRNREAHIVLIAPDDRFALDAWNVHFNDYLIEPPSLESIMHTRHSMDRMT